MYKNQHLNLGAPETKMSKHWLQFLVFPFSDRHGTYIEVSEARGLVITEYLWRVRNWT